jgi:hypothetical protein
MHEVACAGPVKATIFARDRLRRDAYRVSRRKAATDKLEPRW